MDKLKELMSKCKCGVFVSVNEYRDYLGEESTCQRCNGEGEVVICCDDLCQGAGQCFHGDGMIICPECGGEGSI